MYLFNADLKDTSQKMC